jgi:hypothetical protein
MRGMVMKRNKRTPKPKKMSAQSKTNHDVMGLKNIVELALCHVAELIGLAQDIANNMHSSMAHPEVILHVSGRLATLMHCAIRELEEARRAAATF